MTTNQAVTLHGLVERQAARTPNAVAVCAPDADWTYAELDRQATLIAAGLRERGVGPGELAGMAIDRSAGAVAAILGILKTGAAYVPLDPEYPPDRLRFMIEDSGLRAVVYADAEPPTVPGTVPVRLDELVDEAAASVAVTNVAAEDPAYVIYTSGSTGRPKGVVVPHRGIVNRIRWEADHYPTGFEDRVLLHTALSFDISLWEIFVPLNTGGRLVVADPLYRQDPRYLIDIVRTEGVTCLAVVPSLLQALLDEKPGLGECPALREVFSGAEALSPALVRRYFASVDAGLHNMYGPTEYSIDATYWDCGPQDAMAASPIGYPIANTGLYLLGPDGRPVAGGEPGELHISGDGLALGYLKRPDLTRERFVPNPFEGGRMFRTGDLVRRRGDGALEFLGRADDQVKIRGYRIEPGEVARAVEAVDGVERAVVAVVGEGTEAQLTAFVVPAAADPRLVRAEVTASLPEYMVPAVVVPLDRLPIGPTGKVDKAALIALLPLADSVTATGTGDGTGEAQAVPPRSLGAEEALVAQVFADVLGRAGITATDNFFDLGGNSMQALRLLNRLRKQSSRDLPIAVLFEDPTVAGIAAAVRDTGGVRED